MKLSVVTPTLDQAEFLPATLESVRTAAARATALEVEHIVRDGGSTDATLDILAAQDFARWTSEPDSGQAEAINKGLQEADADILCYLCSDDLLEPESLRLVSESFLANPEADFVYGDYFFLESDSGWKRPKFAGEYSYARLHRQNFLSQPATFWRAAIHQQFGMFDQSLHYCMDHEFWLRASRGTSWQYLAQPLATMRLHADAKTSGGLAAMWWESARMQARYGHGLRPYLEACWMTVFGQHYYRMKRLLFRKLGHYQNRRKR